MYELRVYLTSVLFLLSIGCTDISEQSETVGEDSVEQEVTDPTQEVVESKPAGQMEEIRPAPTTPTTPPAVATSADPPGNPTMATAGPEGNASTRRNSAIFLVPSGTEFTVRLAHRISTATNQSGDQFEAILDQDLVIGDRTAVPRGSVVIGQLTEVVPSGKVSGRAKMTLELRELRRGDEPHPLDSNTISVEAEGELKKDAIRVGLGAGIGAAIGAIAGGKKGAAIGTAIGGGGGTAATVMTKGKEVEFETEHQFRFQLRNDLTITLR